MPNLDKTGPNGDGPQTGRGRGVKKQQQGNSQRPQDGRRQGQSKRQ